jgi:ATP-dependent RNA helicase DDX19/DBP5
MSDSAATPTPGGSLADRITKPAEDTKPTEDTKPADSIPAATEAETKKLDWAEDVSSPVAEAKDPIAKETKQMDGQAGEPATGLLPSSEHEVEVKLADIQGDETSPLYSITSFEELGL